MLWHMSSNLYFNLTDRQLAPGSWSRSVDAGVGDLEVEQQVAEVAAVLAAVALHRRVVRLLPGPKLRQIV